VRQSASRAVALLTLVTVFVATPAGAVSTRWTPARLVRLPAAATAVPLGYLPALACPGVRDCVAAGDYVDTLLHVDGLVISETHGVWHAGKTLQAPVGAGAQPGLTPYGVACGSVGNCVVVGSYDDAAGNVEPFVDREVQGVWHRASEVVLPSHATAVGQGAGLRAVACASSAQCVAVGSYTLGVAHGAVEGLVVSLSGGSVVARGVAAPARANVNPVVNLSQVACARAGACVAAGTYVDADNATHGMLVNASAAPTSSVLVAPPNASAYSLVTVGALACASTGNCALVGTYETAGGQLQGFVVESSHTTWRTASELVMPAGAGANPRVFFYGFASLACHASGECTTGGQYVDASGKYQGFISNEVGGAWRSATGHNGGVVAVACPAAGRCHAGAAYQDAQGRYQAFVVGEVHDVWTAGTTLRLPKGATSVGTDGGVYGLVCRTTRSCTATGSYLDAKGNYQGFYSSLG
jgi:hypothetical protein